MKGSSNANKDRLWSKAVFTNLIRYEPSATYDACLRVHGKLIKRSLKTKVLSAFWRAAVFD